jgi:hypothetical protein
MDTRTRYYVFMPDRSTVFFYDMLDALCRAKGNHGAVVQSVPWHYAHSRRWEYSGHTGQFRSVLPHGVPNLHHQ